MAMKLKTVSEATGPAALGVPGTTAQAPYPQSFYHNVKYNNLHGIAQSLVNSIYSPFVGVYAIKLGASNTQVALLSSLPALVSVLTMIPGAAYIRRFPHKKRVTAALFLANRLFVLLLALVPFFGGGHAAAVLVALVALMNLPGAIANVSWQALMGDLVPLEARGDVFAVRNRLAILAGFVPTMVSGYALDFLSFPSGYQLIFALAFVLSLAEIMLFMKLQEEGASPASAARENGRRASFVPFRALSPSALANSVRNKWAEVRSHSRYFEFTVKSLIYYFGWQMGWPLFTIYYVKVLGANNAWIAAFTVTSNLAQFLSFRWWGRIATQRGNIPVLSLATMGMALTPVLVAISSRLWMVQLFNLSMGFFTAGTVLLLFNALLEVTPEADRASYIAYNNTLVNISAAIAPFAGDFALKLLGIRGALWVTAFMRFAGSVAIMTMAGSGGIRDLLSLVIGPKKPRAGCWSRR